MSENINLKYKKMLIDSINEEYLWDFQERLDEDLTEMIYKALEEEGCEIYFDSLPPKMQKIYEKVTQLIDEKLDE